MNSTRIYLVVLSIFALLLFSLPISAQRSTPVQQPSKFKKVANAIPNSYIVVLNDDSVSRNETADVRRAQVSAIANNFAQAHGGQVGFIYESALTGFSIQLPIRRTRTASIL